MKKGLLKRMLDLAHPAFIQSGFSSCHLLFLVHEWWHTLLVGLWSMREG